MTKTIYIISNSPGEIAVWLGPLVKQLKRVEPNIYLTVCLVPCQYATGTEKKVASSYSEVDAVLEPKETLKLILKGRSSKVSKNGAVLYLGGDPMYARLLGFRLHLPAYAYVERPEIGAWGFKHVFLKQKDGDLMASRVVDFNVSRDAVLQKYGLKDCPYLLLFPGSRAQHFENFIDFLGETFRQLKQERPDIHVLVSLSPFISSKLEAQYQAHLDAVGGTVIRGESIELLSIAQLLVTIPGSNTAEAMYTRTPMLIMIPLHKPKYIILDGLAGLIGNIPILGVLIKKLIFIVLSKKYTYFSLPNRYFKRKLVPEIVGAFSQTELQDAILDLWDHAEKRDTQINAFAGIDLEKEDQVRHKLIAAMLGG
jgi:lipid-A-disaccharide synthase